jgi:CheY-like chemotaxis protein
VTRDVVLIVEDEEASREMLEEFLTLEGFRVKAATDGLDALEKMDETVSVVLLDLLMPRMTGWELIERLRSEGTLGALRVVVMTSAPQEAPAGFVVMPKPIDLEELVHTLRALLVPR